MATPAPVLCAVDLSAEADEAIRQAAAHAAAVHADLVVFHAIPETFGAPVPIELMATPPTEDLGSARDAAERAIGDRVAAQLGAAAIDVEVAIVREPVHAAITRKAEEIEASLIVLGARGQSRLEHLFLGSVAEKVMRHAPCPVLITRASPMTGPVLVGCDFSDPSLTAVGLAAEQARQRDVGLVVVHCLGLSFETAGLGGAPLAPLPAEHPQSRASQRQDAERRLGELLGRAGINAEILIDDGEAAPAIVRLAQQLRASLAVVGATGKTGLRRVLLGSVAEAVARHAVCSVLTVRDGEPRPVVLRDRGPEATADENGRIPPRASGEDF